MTIYEMLEISDHSAQEELDRAYQKELHFLENYPASTPDEAVLVAQKIQMLHKAYEQRESPQSAEPETRKAEEKKRPWYIPAPNILYGFHIPCVFYACFWCTDECCRGCCGANREGPGSCTYDCYNVVDKLENAAKGNISLQKIAHVAFENGSRDDRSLMLVQRK